MMDTPRRPRILVTRPAEDAAATAEALLAKGYDPVLAPFLSIRFLDLPEPDLDGIQAVLVTSANGARALARLSRERGVSVLTVGDASARESARLGFRNVASAAGDVAALADLAMANCQPHGGPLLHVAGSRVAGDLAGFLERRGFECRRLVLYEATVAAELPSVARDALTAEPADGVLIHSPRTAATFAGLVRKARLTRGCARMDAFCLSVAVAERIAELGWRGIHVADHPEEAALLRALDSVFFAGSKG